MPPSVYLREFDHPQEQSSRSMISKLRDTYTEWFFSAVSRKADHISSREEQELAQALEFAQPHVVLDGTCIRHHAECADRTIDNYQSACSVASAFARSF